jgi:hypothetical protein
MEMFSSEIYVIMTLKYILTNINYTLCVILKSFKLQFMTLITYGPTLFVIFISKLI